MKKDWFVRCIRSARLVLAITARLVLPLHAHAEVLALVFPDAPFTSNRVPIAVEPRTGTEFGASLFASGTNGQFTWLAEYFKSKDEAEVERTQIGRRIDDRNVIWLGRMHTPLGFWNTDCHHGTFLQTSRRRPLIDDFEDCGSALPKHFNGGVWEGSRIINGGGSPRFNLALGTTATLGRRRV